MCPFSFFLARYMAILGHFWGAEFEAKLTGFALVPRTSPFSFEKKRTPTFSTYLSKKHFFDAFLPENTFSSHFSTKNTFSTHFSPKTPFRWISLLKRFAQSVTLLQHSVKFTSLKIEILIYPVCLHRQSTLLLYTPLALCLNCPCFPHVLLDFQQSSRQAFTEFCSL